MKHKITAVILAILGVLGLTFTIASPAAAEDYTSGNYLKRERNGIKLMVVERGDKITVCDTRSNNNYRARAKIYHRGTYIYTVYGDGNCNTGTKDLREGVNYDIIYSGDSSNTYGASFSNNH